MKKTYSETVEDDIDQEETKEDATHEKDDLRISQPEYSELLKNLDFSKSRMVSLKKKEINRSFQFLMFFQLRLM